MRSARAPPANATRAYVKTYDITTQRIDSGGSKNPAAIAGNAMFTIESSEVTNAPAAAAHRVNGRRPRRVRSVARLGGLRPSPCPLPGGEREALAGHGVGDGVLERLRRAPLASRTRRAVGADLVDV